MSKIPKLYIKNDKGILDKFENRSLFEEYGEDNQEV